MSTRQVVKQKNGGPYTKAQQEERKIQVYHLHFEQSKSAAKIAELLGVNRNTINDDIQYWHKHIASEFRTQDLTVKMVRQIQRMEIQRDRLLEDLDNVESFDEKIRLEKFISEIDNRLTQLFSKMISSGVKSLEPALKPDKIDENEIKEIVRDLLLSDHKPAFDGIYSENDLEFYIIKKTKCNVKHARNLVEKMKQDGLSYCQVTQMDDYYSSLPEPDYSSRYDLGRFANLREYITANEFVSFTKKRDEIRQEIEKQREERFIKKYGPKSQWSDEVKEMFDDPLEDIE